MSWLSLLIFGFLVARGLATVYYADNQNGATTFDGKSLKQPFLTIQDCVDAVSQPEDECRIRGGRYHENVIINKKYGSQGKPIIIGGYEDEQPIIDGTVLLKPTWSWFRKRIFKATLNVDIWQLFVDDVMMTNARWPNALWSDYTVFNNSFWGKSALHAKPDLMIDNGEHDLAGSGLNMTAAMAILNIGSFNTYVAKVLKHEPGNASFSYVNNFGSSHFKPKINQYFLEDKLELLDQPGEWFYDKHSKSLYIWSHDGKNPRKKVVRGKNQTYAFTITNSQHLELEKMTFFATTLRAFTENKTHFIDDIHFNSINFSFPSYSKRMLGSTLPAEWTEIYPSLGKSSNSFRMFNCTFYGSDGVVLQYNGYNVTLENNLFEFNDWSGANMNESTGGLGTIVSQGTNDLFLRNTLRFNGASAGYRLGGGRRGNRTVKLNHFHHQCWGRIQNDGSHVQAQTKTQFNTVMQQNWVHTSPKYALRFDGEPPKVGEYGTMTMNVAMNTGGLMIKGDHHQVLNNLALVKYVDEGGDHQGNGCVLCVLRYVRSNPVPINNETIVLRNGATTANGGKHKKKYWPLAGKIVEYNEIGNVKKQVMDANNFDFRPTTTSVYRKHNVGPYQFDAEMKYYWIPGRQLYKASTPIPPNKSTTVKVNRDALMWLNGYGVNNHRVYFGETPNHLEYKKTLSDESNVFYLEESLVAGKVYYWRIDAVLSTTIIYTGDLWSFTVKSSQENFYL